MKKKKKTQKHRIGLSLILQEKMTLNILPEQFPEMFNSFVRIQKKTKITTLFCFELDL
jgi:hypothetical protein